MAKDPTVIKALRNLEMKLNVKKLLGEKLQISKEGIIDGNDFANIFTRAETNNGTIVHPKEFKPLL